MPAAPVSFQAPKGREVSVETLDKKPHSSIFKYRRLVWKRTNGHWNFETLSKKRGARQN